MTKVVPAKDQLAALPKLQQQVYDLVLRTMLAMFADPYEYEETTIITQVGDANFKATGKVPTKQGWQALFDDHTADQQEAATLPIVHQGDQVPANLQTPQKETTPPVPFTEGTLITAMKTAGKTLDDEAAQAILKDVQGIGTSATRANVLEVLKQRGYLVTEKNKLHVSEAGITLCKAVELEPLLTSPEMTAKWEQALQQISTEERTPDNFLSQIKKFVVKLIADIPTQLTGSAAIKQQINHQQQAQKVAEVFLETPQVTVINKQKFYIVKPKQGEDFTLPKKWSSKTSRLKYIGIMGTGYDVVDIESAHQNKVVVTNIPTYASDAVAQFTFSLLLEVTSQVGLHNQLVHENRWAQAPDFTFWKNRY